MPTINWVRAFITPAVFASTVVLNATFPNRLHRILPKLWYIPDSTTLQTITNAVRPRSVLAAFQLGRIFERLQTLQNGSHSHLQPREQQILDQQLEALLREARLLVHGTLSLSDLQNLQAHITAQDARQSVLKTIRGMISFVNVVWFISIVGVLVTLYPTMAFLGGKLIRIATTWFVHNVLPVLIRMHEFGVFEALCYFICVLFVAQATRYLFAMGVGSPGSYVALTGVCLATATLQYTFYVHIHRHISFEHNTALPNAIVKVETHAVKVFLLSVLVPLAILHRSELLGFFAVWALLACLGLFIGVIPHGYVAGFESESDMDRTALSSLLLVIVFVVARFVWSDHANVVYPFHLGVMILGNCGYFLAMLIRTSPSFGDGRYYVTMQIEMILSLLFALAVGRIFGIDSMNNTASTFAELYVMAQLAQLPYEHWQIVGWFAACCLLYACAVFLRTHPKYLAKVVDSQGLLRA